MANTYELEKLLANPDAQIRIAGFQGGGVTAFISSDVPIGGSNEFDSIFDGSTFEGAQKFLDRLMASLKKVRDPNAKNAETFLNKYSLRSVDNSVYRWTGSNRFSFGLPITFVDLRDDGSVITNLKKVTSAVYPGGTVVGATTVLTPPLGYRGGTGNDVDGTVAVEIGRWFRATGLVVRTANFTISQEVTYGGNPLFASGSIDFETYKVITYDEFSAFFR